MLRVVISTQRTTEMLFLPEIYKSYPGFAKSVVEEAVDRNSIRHSLIKTACDAH